MQKRPDIPVTMHDQFFTTYDHLKIRYQTHYADKAADTPPKAVFILLNGRREYIEMYQPVFDDLHARGLDIWAMDWRGQGKSDRELANFQKGFVKSFDDYQKDLLQFYNLICDHYQQKFPDHQRPKMILFGHSMGGHNALRFGLEHPEKMDAILLSAPMISIHLPKGVGTISRFLVWFNNLIGNGEKYAIAQGDFKRIPFKGNVVFYNQSHFERDQDFMEKTPAMQLGGVTYRWLQEAFRSSQKIIHFNKKLQVPTTILTAKDDFLVDNRIQTQFADQHDLCHQIVIENAIHHTILDLPHTQKIFFEALDKIIDRLHPPAE
jgi:lysophospholipase